MMLEEFQNYTGIYPDADLYEEIEKEYMSGDWDGKQEFCRAYKENIDGFAEKIQRRTAWAPDKKAEDAKLDREVLNSKVKSLTAELDNLRRLLDRELEWRDFEDLNRISEKDYKRLRSAIDVQELSDQEAASYIRREFGFDPAAVRIQREQPVKQVNKYHQLRDTGRKLQRDPLYAATDRNYIGFEVCGYEYEVVNGELTRL